jgi:hypothetical protein
MQIVFEVAVGSGLAGTSTSIYIVAGEEITLKQAHGIALKDARKYGPASVVSIKEIRATVLITPRERRAAANKKQKGEIG